MNNPYFVGNGTDRDLETPVLIIKYPQDMELFPIQCAVNDIKSGKCIFYAFILSVIIACTVPILLLLYLGGTHFTPCHICLFSGAK